MLALAIGTVGKPDRRRNLTGCWPFVSHVRPGSQQRTGARDPLCEQRAIQLDALAREDLRLPIEREVIAIFADDHVRQESRSGHAALDWACRRGAARAGQLGAHVANDLEAHRLEFEHLANVFAQMLEFAATVRAA
jgi:hypothetical protein